MGFLVFLVPLLHCPVARLLSDLLLANFGVYWVFPKSVSETLISWRGSCVGKRRKKAWMATPLTFFFFDRLQRP